MRIFLQVIEVICVLRFRAITNSHYSQEASGIGFASTISIKTLSGPRTW
jgi:hypothetical protein